MATVSDHGLFPVVRMHCPKCSKDVDVDLNQSHLPCNDDAPPQQRVQTRSSKRPRSTLGSWSRGSLATNRASTWIVHPVRESVYTELHSRVKQLASGNLQGTGKCFVVVGPRGTGKSTLLERLVNSAPRGLRIVTEDDLQECGDLVEAVRTRFSDFGSLPNTPAKLAKTLNSKLRTHKGAGLLIVIDECQKLFTKVYSESAHAKSMQFLCAVANLQKERRIMYVLSGSAPHLRSLLFTKIAKDACPSKYSRYNEAYDLNSEKTVPLFIPTQNQ